MIRGGPLYTSSTIDSPAGCEMSKSKSMVLFLSCASLLTRLFYGDNLEAVRQEGRRIENTPS